MYDIDVYVQRGDEVELDSTLTEASIHALLATIEYLIKGTRESQFEHPIVELHVRATHGKAAVTSNSPYAVPCAACGGRGRHEGPGHPYTFPSVR